MPPRIAYPGFERVLDFSNENGNQTYPPGTFPTANNQQSHHIPLPTATESPVHGLAQHNAEEIQPAQPPQENQAQLPGSGNSALNDQNAQTVVIHEVNVANGKIEVFVHQRLGQKYIGVWYKDMNGTVWQADYRVAQLPVDDYVAHLMRPANLDRAVGIANGHADGQPGLQNWGQAGPVMQRTPAHNMNGHQFGMPNWNAPGPATDYNAQL